MEQDPEEMFIAFMLGCIEGMMMTEIDTLRLKLTYPDIQVPQLEDAMVVMMGNMPADEMATHFKSVANLMHLENVSYRSKQMVALNEIVKGNGVRSIFHEEFRSLYINMNDTAAKTIIAVDDNFIIGVPAFFISGLKRQSRNEQS